ERNLSVVHPEIPRRRIPENKNHPRIIAEMLAIHQAELALRPGVCHFDRNGGARLAVSAGYRDAWTARASEQREQDDHGRKRAESDAQAAMQRCSHAQAQI